MNRNELHECKNFRELAMKIWEQSMIESILNNEGIGGKIEDGKTLYGCYLKFQKVKINSEFDTFYNSMARAYNKVLDHKIQDEDDYIAGCIQAYEILCLYFEGKYKFRYIPKDVDDFIETIFTNDSLTREVVSYLVGIQYRITRNKLYHKLEGNEMITPHKWYWHTNKDGVTNNIYTDNRYEYLDQEYKFGQETPEATSYRILDEFYMAEGNVNNILNDIETEVFKEEEDSIYKYIYNNVISNGYKRKIDRLEKCGFFISKQIDEKIDKHNCLSYDDNGKLIYNSNYSVLERFMYGNKKTKFDLIKKEMNKSYMIDILISLPTDIYKEFVHYVNSEDVDNVNIYCYGKRFDYICETILNKLYQQQIMVKEVYYINEKDRVQKIKEIERYIRSLENINGYLKSKDIISIFDKTDKIFNAQMRKRFGIGKKKGLNLNVCLELLEMYGFIFEKVTNVQYIAHIER